MKVLVTGGAGFIGTNLVRALIDLDIKPRILDDFSTGLASNLDGLSVEVFKGSIENLGLVRELANGVDVIVHLGARGSVPRSLRSPIETHNVNATGTLNVMEAARASGARVIYSSSSSVYGRNEELPKNEKMWTLPITPYAASKLAGEGYLEAYQTSYGVPISSFRFFNVFGPWQRPDHDYAAVIPKWIWKAMNNQSIELFGDGSQSRDFTFIGSILEIMIQTIVHGVTWSGPLNLAFGNRITLLEVVDILRLHFPKLEVNFQATRTGDVQHSQNDPTRLKQIFPRIKDFDFSEALGVTVEWMATNATKITGGPRVLN